MRDEQTNEVYLPLNSTVVLKRKQEMLFVPLDFENNLTKDALVDLAAFVSAIAQNDFDTKKEKAPNNILKVDQFSDTSSQWPDKKTVSNSHT